MKTPNTHLHQLIHSLTKSEKRYVKLFSIHTTETFAIRLFDLIEKQENYDEGELKYKLKAEVSDGRFAEIKFYLQNLILNALAAYHRESSVDNELRNYLNHIEILFKKGLFKLCENILKKTRQLAENYERFSCIAELNRWDLELLRIRSFTNVTPKEIEVFFDKSDLNVKQLQNANDFLRLSMIFFLKRQKTGYIRKKNDAHEMKELLTSDLLANEKKAISFGALTHYYLNRFAYHYMIYEYDKAYYYGKVLVNEFQLRPKLIADRSGSYIMSLYNLGMCQAKNKFFSEMPLTVKYLKDFSKQTSKYQPDSVYTIDMLVVKLELERYNLIGKYKDAIDIAKTHFEKIKNGVQMQMTPEDKITICFQLLKAAVSSKDYGLAKKVLNFSISNLDNVVRTDLHSMFRLINMVIYFDAEDEQALESAYASAKKYLIKRNIVFQVESLMLEFFKKQLGGVKGKEIYIRNLHSLKRELSQLQNNPYEKQAFYLFDFSAWVEGKLKSKMPFK